MCAVPFRAVPLFAAPLFAARWPAIRLCAGRRPAVGLFAIEHRGGSPDRIDGDDAVGDEPFAGHDGEGHLATVAATKVKSLLEQEGRDDLRLRIGVQPGGCSGLIYQLYFDERSLDGDALADFEGVEVPMTDEEAAQECRRCLRCDVYGIGALTGRGLESW